MDVGKGIVVVGFLEVYGVQHLDSVGLIDDLSVLIPDRPSLIVQLGRAALEGLAALNQNAAFWVGYDV